MTPLLPLLPLLVPALAQESPPLAAQEPRPFDHGCLLSGDRPPAPAAPQAWATATLAPPGGAAPMAVLPNRVDLVFVGDGYTAGELGLYAGRVDDLVAQVFTRTPFLQYADYFQVHRVDVVSNESGVDNDPLPGIERDTALGMGFWCGGIERRLCVDTSAAWNHAAAAPAADHVLAVANSTKYGGAAYPGQDVATVTGAHFWDWSVATHELGHSLGELGDEYFFSGNGAWPGGELQYPNVSVLDADAMLQTGAKWASWLGSNEPAFDGEQWTFEGAVAYPTGIYRPSFDSLMRSNGRPFNHPSVESLILEIYRLVDPVESSSDPNFIYDEHATLQVVPMRPADHDLSISWQLDGAPIPGAHGESLQLCPLGLAAGWHAVQVEVVDPTPLVRDEQARAQLMRRLIQFPVFSEGGGGGTQPFCMAAPNSVGPGAHVSALGGTSLSAGDLVLRVDGAVPGQPGVFFAGTTAVAVPFGDGFRCAGGAVVRFGNQLVGPSGAAELAVPLPLLPDGTELSPGDERRFQFWYRDPLGPGGSGFNLSDGLHAVFCP